MANATTSSLMSRSPFAMENSNARVVRRSNALLGWAYGHRFRYREAMGFGGPTAPLKAAGVTGALAAFMGAMSVPATRRLVDQFLPDPGEGPSEAARESGYFRVEVTARTTAGAR